MKKKFPARSEKGFLEGGPAPESTATAKGPAAGATGTGEAPAPKKGGTTKLAVATAPKTDDDIVDIEPIDDLAEVEIFEDVVETVDVVVDEKPRKKPAPEEEVPPEIVAEASITYRQGYPDL